MHNPFHEIVKADELSPAQAHNLFVPEASPIWSRVQSPINHLIVGPRGAGKTIALRQLDHNSRRIDYSKQTHVGIYIQISRISTIFQTLFDHARQTEGDSATVLFQRVFSDHVWLEIVRELSEFLKGYSEDILLDIDPATLKRLTGFEVPSIEVLEEKCIEIQAEIEVKAQEWSISERYKWKPIVDLSGSLRRCVDALRKLIPTLKQDQPCLYLLFDESSPIPTECQRVLNGLLHRGGHYCVKLAVRPYEWDLLETTSRRRIELDTDIWPLYIEYADELEDSYVEKMSVVVNRVLSTSMEECEFDLRTNTPDIERIFPREQKIRYSGFRSVCAASSGNPQNLLQICSNIFSTRAEEKKNGSVSFPAANQDAAIRAWSKEYEDRNPDGAARSFCRALLRETRKLSVEGKTIGFRYVDSSPDLFTSEYVPEIYGRKIQHAFSAGFLRRSSTGSSSIFEVPAKFHLSRGLLPRENQSLELPIEPFTIIDGDFIQKTARDSHPVSRSVSANRRGPLKAFLSTAFSLLLQQQRVDIKRHLRNVGIECTDLEDTSGGQFLFTSVHKEIRKSDIAILDATILRPYTMLEVGLCAGAAKPKGVICVVNEDGTRDAITQLEEFIKSIHILTFSFDKDRLEQLAASIFNRAEELLVGPSEFTKVSLTNVSLRPRRRMNTVYVSLPDDSIGVRALKSIRNGLEKIGWTVVTDEDLNTYGANAMQVAIHGAYMCRIGIVDTSGESMPNLLQCYKLGLFAGKRAPWRVLNVEREGSSHPNTFSSVPGMKYFKWNTVDSLADRVVKFIR